MNHSDSVIDAIGVNNPLRIREIIQNHTLDVNFNVNEKRQSFLHFAIIFNKPECFDELLSQGANIHHKTTAGYTPLHTLCGLGMHDVVILQEIIRVGGSIDLLEHESLKGNTPLHLAIQSGCSDEFIRMLISYGARVNTTNSDGNTPLHIAAAANNLSICSELHDHFASINVRNNRGETAYLIARLCGFHELAMWLMSDGANPDTCDYSGMTWIPDEWADSESEEDEYDTYLRNGKEL